MGPGREKNLENPSGRRQGCQASSRTGRVEARGNGNAHCLQWPARCREIDDIPGLFPPSWDSVRQHDYEAWGEVSSRLDSARMSPDEAVAVIIEYLTHSWLDEARKATWSSPADIKAQYRNASILKSRRVVFNIKGNDYRLVVAVAYRFGALYIKFVGTHAHYDAIDADTVEME
jgi:mRNA interferase HigB